VIDLIAQGGMGMVYRAERCDGEFEQAVALKAMQPALAMLAGQTLLRRERQILATLNHPGIAKLLDGGTTADGLIWFAMELVDGKRIDRYCVETKLPWQHRLALFAQVCFAVHEAHMHGLVHRDIKPSNVLVSASNEPKLLDFGIASVGTDLADGSGASRAYTPAYASPEQHNGQPVTTASDIWQLARLLDSILDALPKAIPGAARRDLDAVLARARHPDPTQRYASAAQLASDIERLLDRRPISARSDSALYRALCLMRRHAFISAASAAMAALLVAMAWTFALKLAMERDRAMHAAARAQAVTDFLIGIFAVADPEINRGDRLTANDILDSASEKIAAQLHRTPALRAEMLTTISAIHVSLGQNTRALPLAEQAVALSETDAESTPHDRAARMRLLARIHWRLQHHQQALATAEAALALLEPAPDNDELRVLVLNTIVACQVLLGNYVAAEALQREAIAMLNGMMPVPAHLLGYAHVNLAAILYETERESLARQSVERATQLLNAALGRDHPDSLDAQISLARMLVRSGDLAGARETLERARDILQTLLPPTSSRLPYAWIVTAELELEEHRDVAALAAAHQALELITAAAEPSAPIEVDAYMILGRTLLASGRLDAAIDAFQRAHAAQASEAPPHHPRLIRTHYWLGHALCATSPARGRPHLLSALMIGTFVPYAAHERDLARRSLRHCPERIAAEPGATPQLPAR
jgi:serine/threonine-protein kinase